MHLQSGSQEKGYSSKKGALYEMNCKVWIRSLALGFLFVLSSVVTSYMVFILKKCFNAMNHPWAVYGMLLFMQIIIGLVGEKINQGMRVGKMNIIQRICVLVPALLLFISSVIIICIVGLCLHFSRLICTTDAQILLYIAKEKR